MQEPTPTQLTDQLELLHRQVHPSWVNDGRVSSQAFQPTKKDEGKLSVSRGSIVGAREAYLRHLAKGHHSVGTWSVTVGECRTSGVEAHADPIAKDDPRRLPEDDAHAVIDFSSILGGSAVKRVADKLMGKARERGCQFAASAAPPPNS